MRLRGAVHSGRADGCWTCGEFPRREDAPAPSGARALSAAQRVCAQVGVDVDSDALEIAVSNAAQFEDLHVDFLHADAARLPPRLHADTVVTCVRAAACTASRSRPLLTPASFAETRRSAREERARTLSSYRPLARSRPARCTPCTRRVPGSAEPGRSVPQTSQTQTSTREHVQRFADTTLRVKGKVRSATLATDAATPCLRCAGPDWPSQVLAQLRYDLPASYAFHRAASKDVEVDLWRFEKG